MSRTLTTGSPWRVILAFSVPLLIGNVVQQMYHIVDAVVVGRWLGVDSLAAVGATGSMLFLLIGFAWGLTSGFAIPTAQAFGAGDHAAVRRSVAAGATLTAMTSVVLTVVAPFLSRPLLELLQTPPSSSMMRRPSPSSASSAPGRRCSSTTWRRSSARSATPALR